jgi:hypothetical protein
MSRELEALLWAIAAGGVLMILVALCMVGGLL